MTTRLPTFVLGLAMLAANLAQAPAPQAPTVKILSPDEGSLLSGLTLLKARVTPADGTVGVTFFVDGRQLCRVPRAPYECEFDAGFAVVPHQIRVVATGPGGRAVDTVATHGLDYAETVNVVAVPVTVSVVDNKGRFVKGLPKNVFHVTEDGRPQVITDFTSEQVPLDLVVALDFSGSMKDFAPQVKEAAREFVSQLTRRDRVTILGFNEKIFTLARKSVDPEQRLAAVDRVSPGGSTALYDVIIAGLDILGGEIGRKAMLVFTDAEDQGSHATLLDAERRVQGSGVNLYMIGQGRGTQLDSLKKVMHRLSDASGGRVFVTEKVEGLQGAFADLLRELSNQYLLGYTPANSRRDGTLRRLKVEVDGYQNVHAREAYRAPDK